MLKTYSVMALAVTISVAITGCNQQNNSLFNKHGASTLNEPVQPAAPPPVNPAAPYVLSAQSAGAYIDFNIYNLGTTDLVVKKEDFALISPNTRAVIPYTKDGSIIDLPQPAVVKPNSTLDGRAVFKDESTPMGKRLVFRPDNIGTYADINPASSKR